MALSLIPAAAAEDIEIIDVPEETAEEEPIVIAEPETATPNASVTINAANFPDAHFRSYVSDNFDANGDGVLSASEIAAVVSMDCRDLDINSLKGIEYFTALEKLDCSYNNLAVLDLSQNTALKELNCGANDLLSLNVSNNTALTYLDCSVNQLTSLDVSKNTALMSLFCFKNQLTSLDVSKNTALIYLYCYNNQLTSLDVSKNTVLEDLDASNNHLTSLNVSSTELAYLACCINSITSLDISACPKLIEAYKGTRTEKDADGVKVWQYKSESYILLTDIGVTLTTESVKIGDVDNSGAVNATDRMILARYLAGWEGYEAKITNKKAADVDKSGAIDAKDRMILARYLAGWAGYDSYFN